ncbi:N-Dimethylarginine dimethylaminohydrolase [Ekhidna lutea]|uniref:arginine deiminase n=1 Tax=Ekhidna lutea TaxID=447679 RepID=A0A239HWC0_EKHLU|nr:arginine deiminase family protein [Ekhidna lutea]SNS85627.1 N-Dimethylarginine dimethylaminohydrolase [Ekhidna lutea]
MITVKILDETAPLEAVILGTADSMGDTPEIEKTYDPKSKEHILAGTFPKEVDLIDEMSEVATVLEKHGVKVYRPKSIENLNQIFARDIAFVIDDKLVVPCVTPERKLESDGIQYVIDEVENVLLPDEHERMEGGDIMPWRDHIFVGYSKADDFEKYKVSRTNEAAVEYLKKAFPDFTVKAFELKKSDDDAKENALHLDCCFQPVGKDKAVIYRGGFKNEEDAEFLVKFFGEQNVFEITKEEMYEMNSNFFSISPEVVISDSSFKRLNDQFRKWGIRVEEVKYRETAKMEGLLRCSTMPLRRKYD